jgi:hypothetical protein
VCVGGGVGGRGWRGGRKVGAGEGEGKGGPYHVVYTGSSHISQAWPACQTLGGHEVVCTQVKCTLHVRVKTHHAQPPARAHCCWPMLQPPPKKLWHFSNPTYLHVLVVASEAVSCVLQQQAGQLHKVVGLLAERVWAAALLLYGLC